MGRKTRLTDQFTFPHPLVGAWRDQHYFFSPCFGDVMEQYSVKQVFAMDVEFGTTVSDDGRTSSFAVFVYIGFKASSRPRMVGRKNFPIYFATVRHPDLIEARTPFHGIIMEDILEYGQLPEIVKEEVLAVLRKFLIKDPFPYKRTQWLD